MVRAPAEGGAPAERVHVGEEEDRDDAHLLGVDAYLIGYFCFSYRWRARMLGLCQPRMCTRMDVQRRRLVPSMCQCPSMPHSPGAWCPGKVIIHL